MPLARVLRIKLLRIRLATPTTNASTQRICQCLGRQDQLLVADGVVAIASIGAFVGWTDSMHGEEIADAPVRLLA